MSTVKFNLFFNFLFHNNADLIYTPSGRGVSHLHSKARASAFVCGFNISSLCDTNVNNNHFVHSHRHSTETVENRSTRCRKREQRAAEGRSYDINRGERHLNIYEKHFHLF
jgi:hypothetical protein